jgi:hypothetical protein
MSSGSIFGQLWEWLGWAEHEPVRVTPHFIDDNHTDVSGHTRQGAPVDVELVVRVADRIEKMGHALRPLKKNQSEEETY